MWPCIIKQEGRGRTLIQSRYSIAFLWSDKPDARAGFRETNLNSKRSSSGEDTRFLRPHFRHEWICLLKICSVLWLTLRLHINFLIITQSGRWDILLVNCLWEGCLLFLCLAHTMYNYLCRLTFFHRLTLKFVLRVSAATLLFFDKIFSCWPDATVILYCYIHQGGCVFIRLLVGWWAGLHKNNWMYSNETQ